LEIRTITTAKNVTKNANIDIMQYFVSNKIVIT